MLCARGMLRQYRVVRNCSGEHKFDIRDPNKNQCSAIQSSSGLKSIFFNFLRILGVMLNLKLNWEDNIEHAAKKTSIAFYRCKKTFSKERSLQPKMVLLMYLWTPMVVVQFSLVPVWFSASPAIRASEGANDLYGWKGVLPHGCAFYNFKPGTLVKSCNAIREVRLRELVCWIAKQYGHYSILDTLPNRLSNIPSDYICLHLHLSFRKTFM